MDFPIFPQTTISSTEVLANAAGMSASTFTHGNLRRGQKALAPSGVRLREDGAQGYRTRCRVDRTEDLKNTGDLGRDNLHPENITRTVIRAV